MNCQKKNLTKLIIKDVELLIIITTIYNTDYYMSTIKSTVVNTINSRS